MEAGERIFQLKRLINVKLGVTRSADDLPKRMRTPLKTGGTRGNVPDLQSMLKDYYTIRGWAWDGAPMLETLKRLELNHL